MEQQEVRIPIAGVIEESRLNPTNERQYLVHYPNGEGIYLVKFDDGSQELRSVFAGKQIDDGRHLAHIMCRFPVPAQVIAEEIKKEHEATLKDAIESLRTDVIHAVDVCHENMLKDNAAIFRAINELRESVQASGNGISEKTLLEALKVVAAGKHD
ncbi:hypothetical protein [Hallella sp.]|uniref:hypothetical protein n=1 Tax=Hallella sp. TaxID=2980186 RepID=UPI00307EF2BB